MTKITPKAKRTARSLFRANHKNGISYRSIERNGYTDPLKGIVIKPGVNHTTLSRIANSRGAWLPKDKAILTALGLIKQRKPKAKPKQITEMNANELINLRDRLARKIEHVQHALDQIIY